MLAGLLGAEFAAPELGTGFKGSDAGVAPLGVAAFREVSDGECGELVVVARCLSLSNGVSVGYEWHNALYEIADQLEHGMMDLKHIGLLEFKGFYSVEDGLELGVAFLLDGVVQR